MSMARDTVSGTLANQAAKQSAAHGWEHDIILLIMEGLVILLGVASITILTDATLLESIVGLLKVVCVAYGSMFGMVVYLRHKNPPTTAIRIQRHIESLVKETTPVIQHTYVSIRHVSQHAIHAVIAGEDPNFAWHHGVDWRVVRFKLIRALRTRTQFVGASSITQQLAKNLFLPSWRSYSRKVIELAIVVVMHRVLSKRRILELYMNVVEWGDGLYGIEAAARHYYRIGAADLTREQAARLVAILPNPRRRHPSTQNETSARIQERMALFGW